MIAFEMTSVEYIDILGVEEAKNSNIFLTPVDTHLVSGDILPLFVTYSILKKTKP